MSNLKDFKQIADEMLSDIKADDRLKQITLKKCKAGKQNYTKKYLISAACIVFILTSVFISSLFTNKKVENRDLVLDERIESSQLPKVQEDNNLFITTELNEGKTLETLEDAKKSFIGTFLRPTFIPKEFILSKITGDGEKKDSVYRVVLNYSAGSDTFSIIEEKNDLPNTVIDYKKIKINDTDGYIKNDGSIELFWMDNGVKYTVIGQITEENATKIANEMKK